MLPSLPNQIPPPPVDMVMPPVYHNMLVSNFVVLALVLIWVLRDCYRYKTVIPILIIAGGLVTALTECFWDYLGCVWYPQYGQVPLYRLLGISVPIWMVAAYPISPGGQGYWCFRKLTRGMTRSTFWKAYAFFWITDFILEIPTLNMHVYQYYGPHPFMMLGFPLWQCTGNALMPLMIGTFVYVWRDMFKGWRSLLILVAVPTAMIFAEMGAWWPTLLAMNSGRGYAATYPAAVISMGLSLLLGHAISIKVCVPNPKKIKNQTSSGLAMST